MMNKHRCGKKCLTPFVRSTQRAGSRQKGSDTYFPLMNKFIVACLAWFVIAQAVIALPVKTMADEPLVSRRTDSAEADLISELLIQGLVDTATMICERHLQDSQASQAERARWILLWSQTTIAAMLQSEPSAAEQIRVDAIAAIDQELASDPQHPQMLWFNSQSQLIDLAAGRRAVLAARLKPKADPMRERVLEQIVRVGTDLRELSAAIENEAILERNKNATTVRVSELVSLAVMVATKRIEAIMLRGELFDEGTDDFLASANESLAATQALLAKLPPTSEAREDLRIQLAESLRRVGEFEQATEVVTAILAADANHDRARSLAATIAMDEGDVAKADALLNRSNIGMEIDMARLKLQILKSKKVGDTRDRTAIGDRIQQIGERYGDYARRRAEQLVLGVVSVDSDREADPRVIIAQAASKVREGNADQAGELLAAATRTTKDANAAMQLAIAGAAVYRQANDPMAAANLLRETSLAHYQHPDAPKLHLQSTVLRSESSSAHALIEQLEEGVNTWPEDATVVMAADWLVRLHQSQGNVLSAAQAVGLGGASAMTTERVKAARDLWFDAILQTSASDRERVFQQSVEQLDREAVEERTRDAVIELSVLFGDRESIRLFQPDEVTGEWVKWLLAVRQGTPVVALPDIQTAEPRWLTAAAERLIADGEMYAYDRRGLADGVVMVVGAEPSLPLAQAYLWKNDWPNADATIAKVESQDSKNLDLVRTIAGMLSRSEIEQAKQSGLRRWASISSRLPQGSREWHESKLAAIQTMQSLGDKAGAKRMANYVLLTQPPSDASIKGRYEAVE